MPYLVREMEHSNTKYITFDNRKYRMNKETNKGKQRTKVSGALFAHATGLPCIYFALIQIIAAT